MRATTLARLSARWMGPSCAAPTVISLDIAAPPLAGISACPIASALGVERKLLLRRSEAASAEMRRKCPSHRHGHDSKQRNEQEGGRDTGKIADDAERERSARTRSTAERVEEAERAPLAVVAHELRHRAV